MQGSTDIALDEDGIEQAHKLGQRLAGEPWDLVYTSNLSRAYETGAIIASYLKLDAPSQDERLKEVSGGLTEGTMEDERVSRWGADWRQLDLGIETAGAVHERGLAFLRELLEEHPGKNILIVSHGGFIRHMLRKLTPDLEMPERPLNTSLTLFSVNGDEWVCDLYNCTKHLGDEPFVSSHRGIF
jgi:2,3-bisphosphoglycerate-dependent phosphoglycerate mutase